MPDDRLPTREQIVNRSRPDAPSTCCICWASKSAALDNGVCGDCRRELGRRGMELVAENARLRNLWQDENLIENLFYAHMRGDVRAVLRGALDG